MIATAGLGAGLAATAVAEAAEDGWSSTGPRRGERRRQGEMARAGALHELGSDGVHPPTPTHPDRRHRHPAAEVTYHGRAAHAPPQEGRNALDAAVLGYQAVGALRQHPADRAGPRDLRPRGGGRPSVVPAETEMESVSSARHVRLAPAAQRVIAILEIGCPRHRLR
ncbi:MAG: hypothetical protein R2715_10000 [Ilumatobacteraceae bacterium]